jgi:hypothetical protein
MTIQEKNIKIAQEYGYKDIWEGVPGRFNGCLNGEWSQIPDYFSDLNACHEFEKTICGENFDTPLWVSFLCNLDRVVNKRRAHATAAQRAEAFGKTLNLW